jgi:hypothetical protein
MASPEMVALGKALFAAKEVKDDLEAQLKAVNATILKLATVDLSKMMEDGEVPSFKIEGFGTVFLQTELFVSVLKENRALLHGWLRDIDCGDLVQESVAPQSLKALCKERLQGGKPLPDYVKATPVPTVRTRSK